MDFPFLRLWPTPGLALGSTQGTPGPSNATTAAPVDGGAVPHARRTSEAAVVPTPMPASGSHFVTVPRWTWGTATRTTRPTSGTWGWTRTGLRPTCLTVQDGTCRPRRSGTRASGPCAGSRASPGRSCTGRPAARGPAGSSCAARAAPDRWAGGWRRASTEETTDLTGLRDQVVGNL